MTTRKNKSVEDYWAKYYAPKNLCGLCGNTGSIDTTGIKTPAGCEVGGKWWCICPNGQTYRNLKGGLGPNSERQLQPAAEVYYLGEGETGFYQMHFGFGHRLTFCDFNDLKDAAEDLGLRLVWAEGQKLTNCPEELKPIGEVFYFQALDHDGYYALFINGKVHREYYVFLDLKEDADKLNIKLVWATGQKLAANYYCPEELKHPCRSPYCECDQGSCVHPEFKDARGT